MIKLFLLEYFQKNMMLIHLLLIFYLILKREYIFKFITIRLNWHYMCILIKSRKKYY